MAVYWTPIMPGNGFSPEITLIRDHMKDALRAFELAAPGPPLDAGYEDALRNFVYEYLHLHVPALWMLFDEGPHVNFGINFYRPDMLVGDTGVLLVNELSYVHGGNRYRLRDIIEWGHDYAGGIRGCVNKPLADFVKWFILMDSAGIFHFNPMPICNFQIATDFSGTDCLSISRIRRAFSSLHFLTDIWDIDYDHHPAHAYIFMNYFPAGIGFHELLSALPNPFYADDLTANYIAYRETNPGWPITLSIDNGINALDAILAL
jgi:hypothetical protein